MGLGLVGLRLGLGLGLGLELRLGLGLGLGIERAQGAEQLQAAVRLVAPHGEESTQAVALGVDEGEAHHEVAWL